MLFEEQRKKYKIVRLIFQILRKMRVGKLYYKLLQIFKIRYLHYDLFNFTSYEDFKQYLITHNMPQVIKNLKEGLDEASKQVVDESIGRQLNLPLRNSKYTQKGMYSDYTYPLSIMSPLQLAEYKAYQNELSHLRKKYPGSFVGGQNDKCRNPESFYYHHGLKYLDKEMLEYIRGKVFLDCGAYYGDSSVVFNEYAPSKVYAFEMNLLCKEQYYKNLRLNGIDTDKFVFVNRGISKQASKIKISKKEYAAMTMQSEANVSEDDCFVELVKIDDFCKEHKIGLIKMDIEGAENDAILGAKETIKRDKPLLLITIYHTPQQFFELKPLIESWQLGYKFMIKDLNVFVSLLETTLIGIPKI